jgi:hypothetical protein
MHCRALIVWILAWFWLLVGSGCSTSSELRVPCQELAARGSDAASKAQVPLVGVRTGLDRFVESQYLRGGLDGSGSVPEQEPIRRIQNAILLRERALGDLERVYDAFKALGEYDAGAAVEGKLGDLTTSVNDFSTSVGRNDPLLNNVSSGLITKAGGALAAGVQSETIRKASSEIRIRVVRLRDAMNSEQGQFRGLMSDIAEEDARLIRELKKDELLKDSPALDGSQLLSDMLKEAGADVDPAGAKQMIARHPALGDALAAIRARRQQEELQKQLSILDATAGALDSLITAHEQLERGQPLTLQALQARLAQLAALVEEYKQWRQKDEQAKAARKAATQPG